MAEIKKTPNQKEKDLLSLTKDVLREKEDTIKLLKEAIELNDATKKAQVLEESLPLEFRKTITAIRTVRETMGYCTGQGIFGIVDGLMYAKPVLTEDDLLECKMKLQELIKQL